MYAVKETVSEKLSRLFSASPSKSVDQQPPQARPYTKEGKSITSILSFLLPSTYFANIRGRREVKPLQSHSFTWRSKSFSLRDKPLDDVEVHEDYKEKPHIDPKEGENGPIRSSVCVKETVNADNDNGEPTSAGSIACGSETFEDAPDRHSFEQSLAYLTTDSGSTARHGISLRTLIRKSADISGPCLLITGDKQGAVFGGLLEAPLKPTAKRKYQGTTQSFVFTTLYGEPRLFRPTGANRYFHLCLNDILALGGGGNFALSLDGELLSGSSGPCETFGNSFLAHDQEFEPKNVELWGFAHASRYLPSCQA